MKRALVLVPPLIGHVIPIMNILKSLKDEYEFYVINDKKYINAWKKFGIKKLYHFNWLSINKEKKYFEYYFYNKIIQDNFYLGKLIIEKGIDFDVVIADIFCFIGVIISKLKNTKLFVVYPSIYVFRKITDPSINIQIIFPFNILLNGMIYLLLAIMNITLFFMALYFKLFLVNGGRKFFIKPDTKYFIIPKEFNSKIEVKPPYKYIEYKPYDYLFFNNSFNYTKNNKKNLLISLGTIFNKKQNYKKIIKFLNKNINLECYNIFVYDKYIEVKDLKVINNVALSKLLPHIDIFITHGGINSLLTVLHLKLNIPVIIFPQGAEQKENMKLFYKYYRRNK